MAHVETTFGEQLTHRRCKLEPAQEICDSRTRTAQRVRDGLMRESELLRQPLYAGRFFERVQVLALDIFDQRGRKRLLIRNLLYQRRHRLQSRHACSAPAAFSRDYFISSRR